MFRGRLQEVVAKIVRTISVNRENHGGRVDWLAKGRDGFVQEQKWPYINKEVV